MDMDFVKLDKWIFISVVILNLFVLLKADIDLKDDERQFILDITNVFRKKFASGFYSGNVTVANMNALSYDLDLEEQMIQLRVKCPVPGIYEAKLFDKEMKVVIISNAIVKDLSSVRNIRLDLLNSCHSSHCFNLVQILDPRSSRIGCSLKYCQDDANLICGLDKGAVFSVKDTNKFQYGPPCSRCSSHFFHCLHGNLCASKPQCMRSAVNKCTDKCIDHNPQHCQQFERFCILSTSSTGSLVWSNFMRKMCPKHCGFCKDVLAPISTSHQLVNAEFVQSGIRTRRATECSDFMWVCKLLANQNTCHLLTVQNTCRYSCRKCKSDSFWIRFYREKIIVMTAQNEGSPQQQSRCRDQRKECARWADNNYCYMPIVQYYCPRLCAICPDPLVIRQGNCHEDKSRKLACAAIFNRNLCYAPDLKILCPITCGNTICGPPLRTTTLADECMEPLSRKDVCGTFRNIGYCQAKDVAAFCPQTCKAKQCIRTNPLTNPDLNKDPSVCLSVKKYCYKYSIRMYCRVTCKSTNIQEGTSTAALPTKIVGPTIKTDACYGLNRLCSNPIVKQMCPRICRGASPSTTILTSSSRSPTISSTSTTTTTKSTSTKSTSTKSTSSKSTSTKSTSTTTQSTSTLTTTTESSSSTPRSTTLDEPIFCVGIKLCTNIQIQKLCKRTCGRITSTVRTGTEHKMCEKGVPCNNVNIRDLCWKTCADQKVKTTSTVPPKRSTTTKIKESPNCKVIANKCSKELKRYCPITCRDFNENEVDHPQCPKLKNECGNAAINKLCPIMCRSHRNGIS